MNESVRNEGNPLGARDSNVNAAQAIFWADLLSICDATHEWFAELHGSQILRLPTNRSTSDSIAAHLLEVSLSLKGGNSASGRKKTPPGSLGSVRFRLHIQRKTNHAVWMRLPCRSTTGGLLVSNQGMRYSHSSAGLCRGQFV
jgi:hypothetical protein